MPAANPSTANPPAPDSPRLFATAAAWERWLAAHHAQSAGVFLRHAKKGSTLRSVSYAEALEVALCYGWIDSVKRPESAEAFLQRFSPRGKRSIWSQINCAKAEALIARGRMQPAGLAEIERAKADGRWARAYSSSRTAEIPEDLQTALVQNTQVRTFFATLNRQNRYAILFRLQQAKKPETRALRLGKFVAMLERGEVIYPPPAQPA